MHDIVVMVSMMLPNFHSCFIIDVVMEAIKIMTVI